MIFDAIWSFMASFAWWPFGFGLGLFIGWLIDDNPDKPRLKALKGFKWSQYYNFHQGLAVAIMLFLFAIIVFKVTS